MARWRQDSQTGKLVPIDAAAARRDGIVVRGDIPAFVSPLDGTVVSGTKQYREHCKKHNVVSAQEFTKEFYEGKAKERESFFKGDSKTEVRARKQAVYDAITRAEQNG